MLQNLLYHVSFLWNRLLRISRTRGFGVQSPSAYSFLRDVINGRDYSSEYPVNLKKEMGLQPFSLKRRRLVFRLLSHFQPKHIVLDTRCYPQFIDCVSHHAVCFPMADYDFNSFVPSKFFILDIAVLRDMGIYENMLGSADKNTLLVVFNLYRHPQNISIWNKLLSDSRTGVTFDLYDCGIIFFDLKKYKQNFKVNY